MYKLNKVSIIISTIPAVFIKMMSNVAIIVGAISSPLVKNILI